MDGKEVILLNDWTSMVPVNEETKNYGTLMYASDQVLCAYQQMRPFKANPSDDLHSVVRTLYSFLHQSVPVDPKDIGSFWNERLSVGFWRLLMKCANELNYSEFVSMLRFLFD